MFSRCFFTAVAFFCFLFNFVHADKIYTTGIGSDGKGYCSIFNTDNAEFTLVPVGANPQFIAKTPDGSKVYVANFDDNTVSSINTSTLAVTTISVGTNPQFLAVTPDSSKVYVTNYGSNNVSKIDTSTNTVVETIATDLKPYFIAVTPNGQKAYVANSGSNTVTVFSISNSPVVPANITVGTAPNFLSILPNSTEVYVANNSSNNVSVIRTSDDTVIATIPVGTQPQYIQCSPNGSVIFVTNLGDTPAETGSVFLILQSSKTVGSKYFTGIGFAPKFIAFTPDGSETFVVDQITGIVTPFENFGGSNSVKGPNIVVPTAPGNQIRYPAISINTIPIDLGATLFVGNALGNSLAVIGTTYQGVFLDPVFLRNARIGIAPRYITTISASTGVNGSSVVTSCPSPCRFPYNPFNLYPPLDFMGCQKSNRFLSQEEFFNTITWSLSSTSPAIAFLLYKNGQFIQAYTVLPTGVEELEGPRFNIPAKMTQLVNGNRFCYIDRNVSGCNEYSIVSLDALGHQSVVYTIQL